MFFQCMFLEPHLTTISLKNRSPIKINNRVRHIYLSVGHTIKLKSILKTLENVYGCMLFTKSLTKFNIIGSCCLLELFYWIVPIESQSEMGISQQHDKSK